jgi:hypothetical protein
MLAGEGVLVVAPIVALEEVAQAEGVGGLGQPAEGRYVQLLDALAGETQSGGDGGEGAGEGAVEAVVGDDDQAQAWG